MDATNIVINIHLYLIQCIRNVSSPSSLVPFPITSSSAYSTIPSPPLSNPTLRSSHFFSIASQTLSTTQEPLLFFAFSSISSKLFPQIIHPPPPPPPTPHLHHHLLLQLQLRAQFSTNAILKCSSRPTNVPSPLLTVLPLFVTSNTSSSS